MRGWWVLLLASTCLGDQCSDNTLCKVTHDNVCGYDQTNNINAFFVTNCVMEQCNCRYKAVESSARFVEQDVGNCTKDPYVSLIDECSPDNSSEGSQEEEIPPSEEEVHQRKDSDSLTGGGLMPEDSLEDEEATKGEEEIVSDILDTSKDEIIPILAIDPPKNIDPIEASEENDSGSHQDEIIIPILAIDPPKKIDSLEVSEEDDSGSLQETGPFIIDKGRNHPPLPPPLVLGKLGSMLLQGLAGNLEQSVERKHEPPGKTIIDADIDVNVYIDEKMPFPPHHQHHGHHHHHHEDSQELSDNPTLEIKVPMPFKDSELPNTPPNVKFPLSFEDPELPIPSAVQYLTAGSALPKLDVLAILLTSILAIVWGRY